LHGRRLPRSECAQTTILVVQAGAVHAVAWSRMARMGGGDAAMSQSTPTEEAVDRSAPTDLPIHDLLRRRWSPRAFSARPVEREALALLFEAARWAPSNGNEQPWRFVVATQDRPDAYQRLLGCLVPANQVWARNAPVLAITCAALAFARTGADNAHRRHDVGLAMMALTVQAQALDLYVHQMAGIEPEVARRDLAIPDGFEPVTGVAIGYPGDPASLDPKLRERELAPRVRRPLAESVFLGRFGEPAGWAR
jgi:nitroreductase